MIELPTELGPARIVQSLDELPTRVKEARVVYADVETTFDESTGRKGGFFPYLGDRACGWALTWDDVPGAWYVPIRHRQAHWNLPLDGALRWLREALGSGATWCNHNVKFDAHFAHVDGVEFGGPLKCTLTGAKMLDTDRLTHSLKPLSRDWLKLDMGDEVEVKAWLEGAKTKDYGRVPADVLGRYACMDVCSTRTLEAFVEEHMYEGAPWKLEQLLTPVLFDMEARGLRVDKRATLVKKRECLMHVIEAADEIKRLTDVDFTDSNKCMYELLVNQLDLPVLAWNPRTAQGVRNPNFDKDTMLLYLGHPAVTADPKKRAVVEQVTRYKHADKFLGLFVESFLNYAAEDGRVHTSYDQMKRTSRFGCSTPNFQQASADATALIVPEPGLEFGCADANQAEFRVIANYIGDEELVTAYIDDPTTDIHQWVADQCGVSRTAGKTLDFAMAFGASKGRVTGTLMSNEDLVAEVQASLESGDVDRLVTAVRLRAEEVYATYHERFPGMRQTKSKAEALCKRRGWIKNWYGYRRHLPGRAAYKAWNTLVQGGAAYVVKERMVALAPRYNSDVRAWGAHLVANKHDELLFEGPDMEAFMQRIKPTLDELGDEWTPKPWKVPFVWDVGHSAANWKEAKP